MNRVIYLFLSLCLIHPLGLQAQDSGEEPTEDLQEVVVTKSLNEREGNKDIITVTKSMLEGTRDTGDLLGRIPGVHYNPITTELLYKGSGNVLILVNGVEKDASFIKRLNPGRLDRITVINTPTGMYSEYDAVIDLHVRPRYEGYEGVLVGEGVVLPGDQNGDGRNLTYARGEGQFTYTRERLNLDLYTGYRFNQTGVDDYFDKSYPLNGIQEVTVPTDGDEPNHKSRYREFFANLAADYEISNRHSVSAKVTLKPSSIHDTYDYLLERSDSRAGSVERVTEHMSTDSHGRLDIGAGLWYRGVVGTWNLAANASYTDVSYRRDNSIDMSSGYTLYDPRDITARYWVVKAEGGHFIHPKWYLNLSESFLSATYSEHRPQTGTELSSTRDIRNTLEGSLSWFAGQKGSLSVNAGLSIFRNDYGSMHATHVTPRAGLQAMWAPSSKVFMRLDYRLSSVYPSLSSLQDYGQFTDSLMYSSGNPLLKPNMTHEVTLSATFLQRISMEARYIRTADAIYNYFQGAYGLLPSGTEAPYTVMEPINGNGDQVKFNLSYSDQFGPHWMVSASAGMSWMRASYSSSASSHILPNASWYALYQIPSCTLQIYLSGGLNPHMTVTPQTDMWSLDDGYALSVSKTFFSNRLQIMAMWMMPFHFTSGRTHGGISSDSYAVSYWANNQFRIDNKLQLSLVYRFNGGQKVRKYNRQSESIEI